MNAKQLFAALTVAAAASSAIAADAPATAAAAVTTAAVATAAASTAVVLASADTSGAAAGLNIPTVSIGTSRSRSEVRAEAVEFVKNHKTALAVQLEQYKN